MNTTAPTAKPVAPACKLNPLFHVIWLALPAVLLTFFFLLLGMAGDFDHVIYGQTMAGLGLSFLMFFVTLGVGSWIEERGFARMDVEVEAYRVAVRQWEAQQAAIKAIYRAAEAGRPYTLF